MDYDREGAKNTHDYLKFLAWNQERLDLLGAPSLTFTSVTIHSAGMADPAQGKAWDTEQTIALIFVGKETRAGKLLTECDRAQDHLHGIALALKLIINVCKVRVIKL